MKPNLRHLSFLLAVSVAACGQPSAPASDDAISVSVQNPSDTDRDGAPVVLSYSELVDLRPEWSGEQLAVYDASGQALAVQYDDMDSDGTVDEMVFLADFGPGATVDFAVRPGSPAKPVTGRTDARNWKRPGPEGTLSDMQADTFQTGQDKKWYRYDGPGWENATIGWRIYFDGRNAVDIWGKRTAELFMERLGTSDENYEDDLPWGTDVLKVNSAVGIGGAGVWTGDSVARPFRLDAHVATKVANGPLRTVMRIDYTGWDSPVGKADVRSWHILYADGRTNIHRVELMSGPSPLPFATGIVKHDPAPLKTDAQQGWMYTYGDQAIHGGGLMLAVLMDPARIKNFGEDANSHLALFDLTPGSPVDIYASAQWQGEPGGLWTTEATEAWLDEQSENVRRPLVITLK